MPKITSAYTNILNNFLNVSLSKALPFIFCFWFLIYQNEVSSHFLALYEEYLNQNT